MNFSPQKNCFSHKVPYWASQKCHAGNLRWVWPYIDGLLVYKQEKSLAQKLYLWNLNPYLITYPLPLLRFRGKQSFHIKDFLKSEEEKYRITISNEIYLKIPQENLYNPLVDYRENQIFHDDILRKKNQEMFNLKNFKFSRLLNVF